MTTEEIKIIFDQLRKKEIDSYSISKEDLLQFRAVLEQEEDAIDFRGIARHGGDTLLKYEPGWTK